MSQQEPWLRGAVPGIAVELQPVAHALLFAKEELDRILDSITDEQLWQSPNGAASIGYHVRHCSGSTLRMLKYARGESLTPSDFEVLAQEKEPAAHLTIDDVRSIGHEALDAALELVRATDATSLDQPRVVGRKRLPSTVRGLLSEIVVHTARHIGQMATTARVLR